MDSAYNFDAPQFLDLKGAENENLDNYFNLKMDYDKAILKEGKSRNVSLFMADKENTYISENEGNGGKYSLGQKIRSPVTKENRKSKRDEDEEEDALLEKIGMLQIDSSKKSVKPFRQPQRAIRVFDGVTLCPSSVKKHKMTTRGDIGTRTPILKLRSRSIIRSVESEDETDISMVSAVSDLSQNISEENRPNPQQNWRQQLPQRKPPLLELPKGPSLITMNRNRPVHYAGYEQREQLEYEEMLKHQIKAHPVNEKILKKVCLGLKHPIEKRPTTIPVPFKLMEYRKPKPVEEPPIYRFKAQPVPRKILQSPVGIPPKRIIPATTPKTPAIRVPARVRSAPSPLRRHEHSAMCSNESLPRNTRVEPFSFENRDRLMLARKEEHINKVIMSRKEVLEEEKKAFNSFKAQPVRHFTSGIDTPQINRFEFKKSTTPMPFNLTKTKLPSERNESEIKIAPFRAKPATILAKTPFYPSHSTRAPLEIEAFQMKTETRASERNKFEEKLHKAEEESKKALEKAREEEEKLLREEVSQLRKLAEFKAQPVPKTKPLKIHGSEVALTQPLSPHFRSGKQFKNS